MRFKPLLQGCSIVLAGDFNPAIFSPAWFRLNDIITDLELEAATTNVIHDEVTRFDIDDGLGFEVYPKRFLIRTLEEPFVRISDIASIIFGKLLVHTPVRGLGINYEVHFNTDEAKQRANLGRAIAPLEPWGDWGAEIGKLPGVEGGGVRSLTMEESKPEGREAGFRRVKIEPSVRETVSPTNGIYVMVNDHFGWDEGKSAGDAVSVLLQREFDRSIAKSKAIVSDIMDTSVRLG